MEGDAFEKVTVFSNGSDGYNIFRIPAIVQATSGDLLAFAEAREGGDASEIDLVLKRSNDGGKTWQALEMVQESDRFRDLFQGGNGKVPPITIGNPAPVVDRLDPLHPGRIWLPFTVENNRVFITYSDDHGRTWAERREITPEVKRAEWGWYATGPGHAIQIRRGAFKGRLVVPCDHRIGIDGRDHGPPGAHEIISDDHGLTWQLGAIDNVYDDALNTNEHSVVELNDGRLYFNARDHHGKAPGTRAEAYSDDGGTTFLPFGKSTLFRPCSGLLDPPVVQCAVLRVRSILDGDPDNLILFSGPDENGPTGKGRSDLRIRYSTDETQTWCDGPLLHVGPAAYSDMVRMESGEVGVLFEAGAAGTGRYDTIVFTRFSPNAVTSHK